MCPSVLQPTPFTHHEKPNGRLLANAEENQEGMINAEEQRHRDSRSCCLVMPGTAGLLQAGGAPMNKICLRVKKRELRKGKCIGEVRANARFWCRHGATQRNAMQHPDSDQESSVPATVGMRFVAAVTTCLLAGRAATAVPAPVLLRLATIANFFRSTANRPRMPWTTAQKISRCSTEQVTWTRTYA